MQQHSAVLRQGGRRLAAVVAAGAIAVTLFAGAWAQNHELTGSASGNGRKLSVVFLPGVNVPSIVKADQGRKLSMMTTRARKL
jgi:hypothetical protein